MGARRREWGLRDGSAAPPSHRTLGAPAVRDGQCYAALDVKACECVVARVQACTVSVMSL